MRSPHRAWEREAAPVAGAGAKLSKNPDPPVLFLLSFSPQAGREQAGRRPALVLSPSAYNARTRLCLVCPITTQIKGYPFEVALPARLPVHGVVLSDQVWLLLLD
jgi:mRNA interferase MazF